MLPPFQVSDHELASETGYSAVRAHPARASDPVYPGPPVFSHQQWTLTALNGLADDSIQLRPYSDAPGVAYIAWQFTAAGCL